MTINLTRPTPVIPVEPTTVQADPRDAMMHAFAVAETVVAQLADRPASVCLADNYRGGYGVELYFHREPEHVARFAEQFGVPLSAVPHHNNESSTYTSADVVVNDVQVRAWSLTAAEAVAA